MDDIEDVLETATTTGFDGDTVSLVLHPQYAGYPTASSLADLINDELSVSGYSDAARVEDAQTIRVRIPAESHAEANEFVARLLTFHGGPE